MDKGLNPVTAMLLEKVDSQELRGWTEAWGRLERMLLAVYRSGAVLDEQRRAYRRLRSEIRVDYGRWEADLKVHWQSAQVAGVPLERDPFVYLTTPEDLTAGFVTWQVIQILPAAREALNSFLLEIVRRKRGGA